MRSVPSIVALTLVTTVAFLACAGESIQDPGETVVSIVLTPAVDTLVSLGETVQLSAAARDADGTAVAGVSFTWESSDEDCAAVSSAGLVTASENGTVTITASTGSVSGSASVTVAQSRASVEIDPPSATLASIGETVQLAATAQDANGNAVANTTFTWASSDEDVATVSTSGLVTAVANGAADITASTDDVANPDTAEVTVVQQVDSVAVSPAGASISGVGTAQQFTVEAWDAGGNPISNPSVTWTSLNPNVATIDPSSGVATAVESGQVTIAATTNGTTGYALLTVAVPGAEPVNLWSEMSSGGSADAVWGASATAIFATSGFSILHYEGSGWTTQATQAGAHGRGVWGTSATDVYAVFDDGWIQHYDGTSWSTMVSETGTNLHGVWGASPTDIFAVGNAGTILHYDGISWSAMASGTFADLRDVWGTSATNVFAVGETDWILHYDGTSWSAMASGAFPDTRAVWGTSASNIFASTGGGRILRYDGTSWSLEPIVIGASLENVWGTSSSDVYVVGWNGTMLRYNGSNWIEVESGLGGIIEAVWGMSATDVYTVGRDDVILRGVRGASVAVTPNTHSLTAVGETIRLTAEARDASSSPISGVKYAWESSDLSVASVDATGLVTAVTNGTAMITATAPGGAADTATITVAQLPASPTAAITSPVGGASYAAGETITFTGSGTDQEDGALTGAALTWTSSLDGQIGSGTSFTRDDLSAGTHTVTLTAEDSDNNTGTAAVTITVSTLGTIVPGVWHGTTGAGFSFDFTVATGAVYVTQLQYFWSGLSCEGLTQVSGSTTVSRTPGWSISGRQFTVDPQDYPEITGTFDGNGTAASGNWQWLSCSGTWTATP